MQGEVSQYRVIRNFCIKTIHRTIYQYWPTGQYCIYGKPDKQSYGWIEMYDDRQSNFFSVWPFANQRYYHWAIRLYFFCQTSGNKKIPISLPITKPFYLLPYGSRDCQQVKWMVATTEWIKYHTHDYSYSYYQKHGTVPNHKLGDWNHNGITMFYCYYESKKPSS
ncbi:uncharacterized protein LOC116296049, partial [Actinia tenebrosa]|uniref:Uncharacterized protein LOC116296049 n=1 Tax=Actinia tenebrosa TaxID=6105 RepID=A0A6P8HTZ7_ACTTE